MQSPPFPSYLVPPRSKYPSTGAVYLRIVLSPEQASGMWVFLNIVFYREVLLAPRPTPQLEDHPSSAVRDCLFNIFAATLHIAGRSSIRNLRTRHAVLQHFYASRKYIFVSIKLWQRKTKIIRLLSWGQFIICALLYEVYSKYIILSLRCVIAQECECVSYKQ